MDRGEVGGIEGTAGEGVGGATGSNSSRAMRRDSSGIRHWTDPPHEDNPTRRKNGPRARQKSRHKKTRPACSCGRVNLPIRAFVPVV